MTAILVIDVQNDYFPGGAFPLVNQEAAAAVVSKVIAHGRKNKIPIFHIQHVSADPERVPFMIRGTNGVEIHESAKPAEGEPVIEKAYPNSFLKTTLKEHLDKHNIKNLVLTGSMSQNCVEATTRAGSDMGYSCTVIADACACPDLEFDGVKVPAAHVHASTMAELALGYGKVILSKEYLA